MSDQTQKQSREITLRFRVTEEERERIEREAKVAGETMSQYVRRRVLRD